MRRPTSTDVVPAAPAAPPATPQAPKPRPKLLHELHTPSFSIETYDDDTCCLTAHDAWGCHQSSVELHIDELEEAIESLYDANI